MKVKARRTAAADAVATPGEPGAAHRELFVPQLRGTYFVLVRYKLVLGILASYVVAAWLQGVVGGVAAEFSFSSSVILGYMGKREGKKTYNS